MSRLMLRSRRDGVNSRTLKFQILQVFHVDGIDNMKVYKRLLFQRHFHRFIEPNQLLA
jgi:hypothetical protein